MSKTVPSIEPQV